MKKDLARQISRTYYYNPLHFVIDIIRAKPTKQQQEVLRAFEYSRGKNEYNVDFEQVWVAVKSGQGPGKTTLAAWLIMWFLATRHNAFVPCTAPTSTQLKSVLWRELAKWQERSLIKDWFELTSYKFSVKGHESKWYAIARTSNKPESLQGLHEDNMFFVIDEASGIPEEMMEVIHGTLTNEGAYCFMIGNPTTISGTFYNAFHKDKKLWKTFTMNSEKSERVSKEHIQRMRAKYGEHTDVYRVRVLGEFPSGATDSMFGIDEVTKMMNRELPEPTIMKAIYGVDVARFGDDKTVIARRIGMTIEILGEYFGKDTMETSGILLNFIKNDLEKGFEVYCNIDDTGVGGGVTDRMRELGHAGKHNAVINPVNNGSKAFDYDYYANKGSELWGRIKEQKDNLKIPNDDDLLVEMTSRKKMMTSSGTLRLESKQDMKKRGLTSPDKTDAISLTMEEGQKFTILEDPEGLMF